ncbi:hypothetical protein H312_00687 [Anncaliia algerae PRA339]|uniref:DNA topoisomerase 2 n=1 Tax=Anncaliia algerae PRA339 TaxID=1288291 RepID=A0A059F4M9_9MICR|nr:hypothetical protein H312_00687 [Anncaliia algerae PRA339]
MEKNNEINFEEVMKEKSIEQQYQKKTQIEHIIIRPDTYIGSVEKEEQSMFVWDDLSNKIVQRKISYVPGLYKIFDEIIVNAADNKIRDPSMSVIKVNIDSERNVISVYNNGKGIPVQIHKKEKVYVPELIFGHLLTSSNYDDKEKKVTGGRNGYGAKLCNIFSDEFIVETADSKVKKKFYQKFSQNMSIKGQPIISDWNKEDFTKITFKPDLTKFGMSSFDSDFISLVKKRVYDLAGILKGVKVYLNDQRTEVKSFKDYISLYLKNDTPVIHEIVNDKWEVAVTLSDEQFQQVSFVNSICTSKGGTHVNHFLDQLIDPIIDYGKKKEKNLPIKSLHVKNSMFVFLNCLIENPAFDSQTKENLTLRVSAFGSKCTLKDDFIKKVITKSGIWDKILEAAKIRQNLDLKKSDGSKKNKLTGELIAKLEDANNAGRANSSKCTLILTEGDSAKTLAVSGLSVVGRDFYGVFPLKGKMLNVREANVKQISENKEISALKQILGLKHGTVYNTTQGLRYGHVLIMTDQDHDGSHIKGLIINFFDHFFPSLLKIPDFLQEFITPIVRVTKNNDKIDFFTIPEYEEWKKAHSGENYKIKYYKGLGTSTKQDAINYFSNLSKHVKSFIPLTESDKALVDLAFNKKKADERKNWLKGFVPGTYLDNSLSEISISDFVNKEFILFSMADNIRSIPNFCDGLKPGQRKILFSAFKRKLKNEIKVSEFAGYVSEQSAYHHGDTSLCSTIISMAQNFVGSNNINLLQPEGQFGSRLSGGKDAAAARYLHTCLTPLAFKIFDEKDEALLNYLNEDGKSIEPDYFVPIVPMVLVNGTEGIGTGWSTFIPQFCPKEIVKNLFNLLDDKEYVEMKPFYRNFKGNIEDIGEGRYSIHGIYHTVDNSIHITELPVGSWTSSYKENVICKLLKDKEVEDLREYHTDSLVHFELEFMYDKFDSFTRSGVEKKLKLISQFSLTNMVCFDRHGKIKKYNSIKEIMLDFYSLRLEYYCKRKAHLLKCLGEKVVQLENKIKFIKEVVNNTLIISKRKRKDICDELERKNYIKIDDDYEYLLGMAISSLTEERIEKIEKDVAAMKREYEELISKSPKQLWKDDLNTFLSDYEEYYNQNLVNESTKELPDSKKRRKHNKTGKSLAKIDPSSKKSKNTKSSEPVKRIKLDDKKEKKINKKKVSNNKEILNKDIVIVKKDNSSEDSEELVTDRKRKPWEKYNTKLDSDTE